MNNKVTFQELVDAIAEQSGKSKQFTHDFIKDLASLIRESLEKDGNINIAGLGKFELKKMDEREGYNPQTEEKITIPAHNKIDFTPYKDLRELVNAPYSHMEPEVIEDEGDGEEEAVSDEGEEQTDESAESIPPVSPTESSEEPGKKKAPWEEDMESEIEVDEDDPFGLNAQRTSGPPLSFEDEDEQDKDGDNDDIVEFTPGLEPDIEETEEKAPETEESAESEPPVAPEKESDAGAEEETESGIDEEAEEETEDEYKKPVPPVTDTKEETPTSKEESKAEEPVRKKDEVNKEESETKPKSGITFRDRRHRQRDSGGGSTFWIIAAAFIILLIAIGAWYFMGSRQGVPPNSMDSQVVQNEKTAEEQKEQESAQATESQQDQQTAANQPSEPGQDTDADAQQAQNAQQQAASGRQAAETDEPSVETITVVSGQTLWGIADNEYDNPYLWPWIYDTNKPEIENPNIIYVGQALDIPQRRGSDNGLSASDSLQVALGYVETYLWYKENELENARFYLYAAKKYHSRVFEHTDAKIDEADLAFANRAQ